MYKKSIYFIYLLISIIAYFIFSVSFLLMYIDTDKTVQELNAINIVAGTMFWLGLIIGIFMQVLLSSSIKKFCSKNSARILTLNKRKPGLISFFQNRIASFFDITMIISLAGLIISIVLTDASGFSCYIFTALFVFCLCTHSIFNGNNYYFIKNKDKIINSLTKTRKTSFVLERKNKQ